MHFFSRRPNHNLQDGLFQIASQTLTLVQINNTNNISYGNNSTNIQYNNFNAKFETRDEDNCGSGNNTRKNRENQAHSSSSSVDCEQIQILLPSDKNTKKTFSHYRHRLSTVLESNNPPQQQSGDAGDDFELWDHSQMLRSSQEAAVYKSWCKPSCIPISVILILIILVVLLPLLDHANDKASTHAKYNLTHPVCSDSCNIKLVESIPEGLIYPKGSPTFPSTYEIWHYLILLAEKTIDIGSFYWTLRSDDVYNHTSSWQGDKIFQLLLTAGQQKHIKIRIAQNTPSKQQPNLDTEILIKKKAAEVRSVNFQRLIGAGVLHTKLWIIDGKHIYIGSANMDWRALTQVKELGVMITNCSCLAQDVSKIFKIYWDMGKDTAVIPPRWPEEYATKFNSDTPIRIDFNNNAQDFNTYFSSSPPQMSAKGRTQDLDAILDIILHAEDFIHIAVMDYFPLTIYTPKVEYWPNIDNALRKAAINNKVSIKLLVSWWNHSQSSEDYFLKSLESLSNSYRGVDIQVKRFIVPTSEDQSKIPFGRVNHNKYMVTDRTAYIGTSNWSGDYFINTAGVGLVMTDANIDRNESIPTIRTDLANIFQRDWNSKYAVNLKHE